MFTNADPSLRRFWHPVTLEANIAEEKPHPIRILGEAWLLARLDGEITAMRDLCPHRLVPLSAGKIVGGEIQCAYHGYRFGRDGKATVIPALTAETPIPPKACVATAPVMLRFGLVWICLSDDPITELLDDAPYLDPGNDLFVAGPYSTKVSAGILADNFLDCGHFPFIHKDTFGAADDGRPVLDVSRSRWRIVQRQTQLIGGAHIDGPQVHQSRYEVAAPFSVELKLERPDGTDYIWSFACPVDADNTIWYMVHAYPLGGDKSQIDAARELQERVAVEDLSILELMEDPNVPTDIRAEVHTKADLGCLEYRRLLADVSKLA